MLKNNWFNIPALILAGAMSASAAGADISDDAVKIGAIVDMSGVYSKHGGPGVVEAARMAIEDFGGEVLGKPIELVSADYQNKVDVAMSTTRRWFDRDNVDMVIESTDSASALALFELGENEEKITIAAGSASTALTNDGCSPYGVHYVYDTYALATGTGNAILAEGNEDWFFITADYAFGHSLEQNTANVVKANGGNVVGKVRHPLSTTDFASYLLQAQSSGADVVALANAGTDFSTAVKQASEFGITQSGQILAGMLVFLHDIAALGLENAQGMQFTTGFYWDQNPEKREWSQRFYERHGSMPSMVQAGAYSAVTNYLKAVEEAGTDATKPVMKQFRSMEINDFFAKNGRIREDGRMVYDMYLARIKKPSESEGEWDLVEIVRTIPGDEAYMPLEQSTCKLVNK